CQKYSSSPLTF
nr:immunoglobulin light chain junction region [Macaca mulatta]MOV34412.1 immunoglobulin light chain junction region [Macaca mulatta]MOV34897.1 immunoglobulin light chain junction region [Macaca mulatta]MOV35157.1 immunoglobulin light chain junction region [Macaca mulatta]MOW53337.1 immunoglobulin light chain junction region [Macaca mulatta]